MRPDELFEKSIGKKPGKKEDPEQELRDAITRIGRDLSVYENMAERYKKARETGDYSGIPDSSRILFAESEDKARSLREELKSYREELEDLLKA